MTNDVAWLPVPGWPNYLVSDQGDVWSEKSQKILLSTPRKDGRRCVTLAEKGVQKRRLVYHLVLEAFVGQRSPGTEARHLNDVPNDDRLVNLAWGTSSENKQDIIRNTGRTACSNGHEYTPETTYLYRGTRQCRICRSTPNAKTCNLQDCNKPVLARDMCSKHYTRWYKHGDPLRRSA